MTTAARPTWHPAQGSATRSNNTSKQFSSRDLPGHKKLKFRQPGQNTNDDVKKRDLKEELEEREKKHFFGTNKLSTDVNELNNQKDETEEVELDRIEGPPEKRQKIDLDETEKQQAAKNINLDDADDDDENEEDDDENEDAELLRELERIKKERAEEQAKKEKARQAQQNQDQEEIILRGNPILANNLGFSEPNFTVKRRWDDDVIFKNQAKEVDNKKRFINDTIRNDFHKKFLEKYIK